MGFIHVDTDTWVSCWLLIARAISADILNEVKSFVLLSWEYSYPNSDLNHFSKTFFKCSPISCHGYHIGKRIYIIITIKVDNLIKWPLQIFCPCENWGGKETYDDE